MQLVGIIAKKKDVHAIRKEIKEIETEKIEIIEITKDNIKNLRNIKFEEIIFLDNIELDSDEYKYMNELISKERFLILNGDVKVNILEKLNIQEPIKIITFGFNSKSTITISSVSEDKIIICLQRDIKKANGEIIDKQEKEIELKKYNKKIYNNLVVFIIKELHKI